VSTAASEPDDDDYDDFDEDEDLVDQAVASRWVNMATIVGASLVVVVALQIVFAVIESLMYKTNEPQGVPTGDFLHRLGYPFGSLGTTTLLYLVAAVALLSLPAYFGDRRSDSQERLARVAAVVAAVTAVMLALGSLLAVRANFHVYAENGRSVPGYVIVQYITFLVGNLGTAVIAFYASVQLMSLRDRG